MPIPAERRHAWARESVARLAAGRPVPRYGSKEWETCDDAELRYCGLLVAAEAWAADGDNLPAALSLEQSRAVADGGEWMLSDAQLADQPALRAALNGDPGPLQTLTTAAAVICPGPYDWDTVARDAVAAACRAIDAGWRP